MVVVGVRCSSCRPNFTTLFSRRTPHVSGQLPSTFLFFSHNSNSAMHKTLYQKKISITSSSIQFFFGIGHLMIIQSLRDDFSICKKPDSCEIYLPPKNQSSSSHQKMGILTSLLMELLVTNALLLVTPLEAMAETCEAEQSLFNMNMPLLLLVALTGATVGGLVARQRKGELQRLNEQLMQINTALKRQAKIESYAPTLSYAPVGANKIPGNEVIVDPRKQDLVFRLKNGKNFLRNQDPDKAFLEFKAALELSQTIKDPIQEKKAARGLGASLQRQGKYGEAINYHSMVLSISEREGEDSGNTEAFGAIADCYTELGDMDQAATFYDHYISRLQAD